MDQKKDNMSLQAKTSFIGTNIGIKIAELRKKKGLKQDELGALIGVTSQAVSKWEHGGVPDSCLIPIIADKLGVTTDELFGCHTERNIYAYTEEEFLDFVYHYCHNLCFDSRDGEEIGNFGTSDKYFDMIYRITEAVYNGCLCPSRYLNEEWTPGTESDKDMLILNEVCTDEGTSVITHNDDFRFLVTVKDTAGLSERLLDNELLTEFFAEFADPDFLRLMIYVQSKGEIFGQYTPEYLSGILQIPMEKITILCEKLDKYSFWTKRSCIMNNVTCTVYVVERNTFFRPFLMLAYMMIQKSKMFKNRIQYRTKKML